MADSPLPVPGTRTARKIGGGAVLRPLLPTDAAAFHERIVASRAHLDRWLRWSGAILTLDDARGFLEEFAAPRPRGGFHEGIWAEGRLAGGVICWYEDPANRNAEVGYWLGHEFTGRGLATHATALVVERLFAEHGLHRVEMQCGVENAASRRVPERLGFRLEGTRRESHWITDRFVDHCVYGCLDREWDSGARSRG